MSLERVEIDSDEDGFRIVLEGDLLVIATRGDGRQSLDRLSLRLPQDAAISLLREVDEKIRPWYIEGESVRHDHKRYRRTGELPDYVSEDRLAKGAPLTPRRLEGGASTPPSDLAGRADYERKRERENR